MADVYVYEPQRGEREVIVIRTRGRGTPNRYRVYINPLELEGASCMYPTSSLPLAAGGGFTQLRPGDSGLCSLYLRE